MNVFSNNDKNMIKEWDTLYLLLKSQNCKRIKFYCFKVNYCLYPFIEILLSCKSNNVYSYLEIEIDYKLVTNHEMFKNFVMNEVFFDFVKYLNTVTIFYVDSTLLINVQTIPQKSFKFSNYRVAVLDEILNVHKIYNKEITVEVIRYFHNNLSFFLLTNKNNEYYEIPSVGFTQHEETELNFVYRFENFKSREKNKFGAFYYFKNYYGIDFSKSPLYLVRYVVFLGKTKTLYKNITAENNWYDYYNSLSIGGLEQDATDETYSYGFVITDRVKHKSIDTFYDEIC